MDLVDLGDIRAGMAFLNLDFTHIEKWPLALRTLPLAQLDAGHDQDLKADLLYQPQLLIYIYISGGPWISHLSLQ